LRRREGEEKKLFDKRGREANELERRGRGRRRRVRIQPKEEGPGKKTDEKKGPGERKKNQ
jgi:hypothetical protein